MSVPSSCSVRPGDSSRTRAASKSVTPPSTEQQPVKPLVVAVAPRASTPKRVVTPRKSDVRMSAQKQAKDAQLSSTLEQLETLWVSSGQAALTPRRRAEAEARRPGTAFDAVIPPVLAHVISSGGGSGTLSSALSSITPAIPTILGQALGAGRSLSPGTSQLLSKVYGAANSR